MSNFPTSTDNTPDLQDGVDYIEAGDVNIVKDGVEAVQAFIGASGASQSHNTDMLAQLAALLPTIRLSYVNTTTVQASAGVATCLNSAGTIRKLRKNTSTTNITGSNLDSGGPSFANSTTYHIYAVADATATTVTFTVSTNATTPSGPTTFLKIGGFATDGSGNVIESTVWSVAGQRVIQAKFKQVSTAITTNTTIPNDDTVPQNTEGVEVFTLDIVPKATTNRLVFFASLPYDAPTAGSIEVIALFQDSTANALAAMAHNQGTATGFGLLALMHEMAAGTTSKTTFKIRAGSSDANTMTINGEASNRKYGGVMGATLLILELGD